MAKPVPDRAILDRLDESIDEDWPQFFAGMGTFEYHSMRMIAAVSKRGDDWGILWECVYGDYMGHPDDSYGAAIHHYACGTRGVVEHRGTERLPIEWSRPDRKGPSIEGIVIEGPAGKLRCTDAMIDKLDLRPKSTTTRHLRGGADDPQFMLLLRAYLAKYPDALWTDAEELLPLLEIGDDCTLVVESTAFEHVVPAATGPLARFAIKPSESPTYRSLATALTRRSAKHFVPGVSNLDWRQWAIYPEAKRSEPKKKPVKRKR